MSWELSRKKLEEGNLRFCEDSLLRKNADGARRKELLGGQEPFATVITCSDSRIVPELIFDVGLGELFVIRVAGNIIDDAVIASVEYSVAHLGVPLVVVLGHEGCGAIKATVDGEKGGHMEALACEIRPSVCEIAEPETHLTEIAKLNAQKGLKKLSDSDPVLSEAATSGQTKFLCACYSLESGKVEFDI